MRFRERFSAVWQSRQPRERRALAILASVLSLALLGQLLWSALGERERLRSLLPRLATQLEGLKAEAEEWRLLAALPERRWMAHDERLRKEIAAGAGAIGLSAAWRDPGRLQIAGQASFDGWIKWLGQTQADHGLRVVRAKVEVAGPGLVMLEAELVPVGGGSH